MKLSPNAVDVSTSTISEIRARARDVIARGGIQPGLVPVIGRLYHSPRRYSLGFRFQTSLGVTEELRDGGVWMPVEVVTAEPGTAAPVAVPTFAADVSDMMRVWDRIMAGARKAFPGASEERLYQIASGAMRHAMGIVERG